MLERLAFRSDEAARAAQYAELRLRLSGLLDGEDDAVAAMATVVCELHHAFAAFHWTGVYRVARPELLIIGPYQGGHGCLRIPFDRGVCGAAARTRQSQRVPDVHARADHIACSSSTRSELVVPILRPDGEVIGVIDLDSDHLDAFDALDQHEVEQVAADLGRRFGSLG